MIRRRYAFAVVVVSAVLLSCSRPAADRSEPARPAASARAAWLKEGIVMVGSWEPPSFQVRRGGQETDAVERWNRERSEESVRKLKEAGVNLVITNLHKGFGLRTEAEEIEATRVFTRLAHRYGLKVGGYVGATMGYETFFAEEPDARNWVQVDDRGRPVVYNPEQTFRYAACRNNPGYGAFLKRVLRLGVRDVNLDLIHFDQMSLWPEPNSCRCDYCRTQFGEFLRARYSVPQRKARFGFTRIDDIVPPVVAADGPARVPEVRSPLVQDWASFRAASLAQRLTEYDDYIRGMNSEVAVEGNPNINLAKNAGFSQGLDYSQLLQHGDIFWSEEPNHAAWTADGRLVSKIRSFKIVRGMGKSLFMYTGGRYGAQSLDSPPELRLAEAMAYNGVNLGMVGDLSPEGVVLTPAAREYIRFFRQHVKDLVDTSSVADVAVLRFFPSVEFNPGRSNVSTVLFEQALIQSKVPFDIVVDPQLKNLGKYKVLVLADQDALSDEQIGIIRTFVRNGGGLIATGNSSWLTEWRLRRGRFGLADVLGLEAPPKEGAANKPVQRAFGAGRVVYIPAIEPATVPPPAQVPYYFGNEHWKLPKNYKDIVSAVDWAARGQITASVEAPLSVTLEVAEQKSSNTWLLHVVNFDFSHPSRNLAVKVRLPEGLKAAQVILDSPDGISGQSLAASMRDNVVSFRIPQLKVYDLVRLKLEKR